MNLCELCYNGECIALGANNNPKLVRCGKFKLDQLEFMTQLNIIREALKLDEN